MTEPPVDPGLRNYATPRQAEYLDAVIEHGSHRAAAAAIGVHNSAISRAVQAVQKKAAQQGYAPGHFVDGVAPGYRMGKVTIQRGPNGVERVWERQSPNQEDVAASLRMLAEELASEYAFQGKSPIGPKPTLLNSSILTVYKFGDPHFGMESSVEAGGDNFDLDDADNLTRQAIDRMAAVTPPSTVCILEVIGDTMHANDSSGLTPGHKNPLDVDRRGFSYALMRCARALVYAIRRLLEKHETVKVWFLEGNHDPDSSAAVALMLALHFDNNPRVQIDTSRAVFRYYRFGKVLLGAHHGDRVKMDALPLLMAVDCPEDWGLSVYRYITTGHIHHDVVKEVQGVRVESLRTLAPKDPYHMGKGYRALRDTRAVVYHENYGECERHTVAAAMLEDAAA